MAPQIPKLPEPHLCMALFFCPLPGVSGLVRTWWPKDLPSSEFIPTCPGCQGCQGLPGQGQEAPRPSPCLAESPLTCKGWSLASFPLGLPRVLMEEGHPEKLGSSGGEKLVRT